jgi:hypothetical protein
MGLFAGSAFEYYDYYCDNCWRSHTPPASPSDDKFAFAACVLGAILAYESLLILISCYHFADLETRAIHFYMTMLDFLGLREGRFGWAPTWRPDEEAETPPIAQEPAPQTGQVSLTQIARTASAQDEQSRHSESDASAVPQTGESSRPFNAPG